LIFPLQGRQGFRKYEGLAKAKDVSDAVGSPAAVFLVAGCSSGLKTGRVSLCHLDCPDQVGFFHLPGLDSHLFCNYFNLFNSHVRSLDYFYERDGPTSIIKKSKIYPGWYSVNIFNGINYL
jgi:hypothetical protein